MIRWDCRRSTHVLCSVHVLCALLCLATAESWAVPASAERHPDAAQQQLSISFEEYELPNGLEVLLHEDHGLPKVSVNIWYRAGPANEPAGRSGFAHLFEHLMFEGSLHVQDDFDELLESLGATNVNGTTSFDRTNYFATVPSEHLELLLWLESDRMGFLEPALTQDKLDRQREVVLNERRESYEVRPYGRSDLAVYEQLFPKGHPYRSSVIGSEADIRKATLDEARAFHRAYYAPNNATLAVAGDFDRSQTKAWISKYFEGLPAQPAPRRTSYPLPQVDGPLRVVVSEPVRLERLSMAWVVPPAFSDSEAALELGLEVLGSGKSSRLFQALVAQGLAVSVSSWLDDNALASVAGIDVTVPSSRSVEDIEPVLWQQLELLAREGPSPRELARSLKGLSLGLRSSLQLLNTSGGEGGRAGLMQKLNHYLGTPGALPQHMAHLSGTSSGEVARVLSRLLTRERSLSVITRSQTSTGKGTK